MMKSELTVIIATYNRPELLRVVLKYWACYPVQVLVLDGSDNSTIDSEHVVTNKVRYFHLPCSLEERLLFASSEIKTEYSILACDDEIYLYSALVKGMSVLKADSTVSAVLGATLGFFKDGDRLSLFPEYITAQNLSITGDTPEKRVQERVAVPGNLIFYSLTRSVTMRSALKLIGENHYSCPYISEYLMEAMLCASGYVRYLPNLMWLRNRCGKIVDNEDWDRGVLLRDWCKVADNIPDMLKLKESLERHLSKVSGDVFVSGQKIIELFCDSELSSQNKSQAFKIAKHNLVIDKNEWQIVTNFVNALASY